MSISPAPGYFEVDSVTAPIPTTYHLVNGCHLGIYRTKHVYAWIKPGLRVELCQFRGRVEVYVFEDEIPMFTAYLDMFEPGAKRVLGALFTEGAKRIEEIDRELVREMVWRVQSWKPALSNEEALNLRRLGEVHDQIKHPPRGAR